MKWGRAFDQTHLQRTGGGLRGGGGGGGHCLTTGHSAGGEREREFSGASRRVDCVSNDNLCPTQPNFFAFAETTLIVSSVVVVHEQTFRVYC